MISLFWMNQIVVGSFLAGNQHEPKAKKQKADHITVNPSVAYPISSAEVEDPYRTSSSFRGENWSSMPPDSRNKPADINVTLHG